MNKMHIPVETPAWGTYQNTYIHTYDPLGHCEWLILHIKYKILVSFSRICEDQSKFSMVFLATPRQVN
jgi:hypothetical protein